MTYITAKILSTTSHVKLINKRKLTKVVLNINSETFIMNILALKAIKGICLF